MPDVFDYHQGDGPVLISFPHDGTDFPPRLKPLFNEHGIKNTDCDWFISDLYRCIPDRADSSFIKPKFSRYVIDLNRAPNGEPLYPGKMETGLCPVTTFNGVPIYLPGNQPDDNEIRTRIETYWQPCHHHIHSELKRIKDRHGFAILWDAHSIRGEVPQLFDGVLPDLNFGTAGGRSCGRELIDQLVQHANDASSYSVVLNGRFKGGYITRHYGDPENRVNSIQLEINQSAYLEDSEEPQIDHEKARQLSRLLQALIHLAINLQY